MNTSKISKIILWIVVLFPLIIWILNNHSPNIFKNTSIFSESLGQISPLIGLTLLSISFILLTRLKYLEIAFEGLDKIYRTSAVVSALGFILLLFHPLFLASKYLPQKVSLAARVLLVNDTVEILVGKMALAGFAILVGVTIYTKIGYRNWKIVQVLMGPMFVLGAYHAIKMSQKISNNSMITSYLYTISALGIICYLYSLFIRPFIFQKKFVIENLDLFNENYAVINLRNEEGFNYKSGQFILAKFKDANMIGQNMFFISSVPGKKSIQIITKTLDGYSQKIRYLSKGSLAYVDGPYGMFSYLPYATKRHVWIAQDIGAIPFVSMGEEMLSQNSGVPSIEIHYIEKNEESAPALSFFKKLASVSRTVLLKTHFIDKNEKFDINSIETLSQGELRNVHFFLSGNSYYMNDLADKIIKKGVDKDNIHFQYTNLK